MPSVSEITQRLIDIVQANSDLQDVWIRGKISEIRQTQNNIPNFTLTDNNENIQFEEATPIALNTVKEFVENAHQNNEMVPEHIQFVLFDEETYNCYIKEFSKLGFGLSCLIG